MIVGVDPKNTELKGKELQKEVLNTLRKILSSDLVGKRGDSYLIAAHGDYGGCVSVDLDGYVHEESQEVLWNFGSIQIKDCHQEAGCYVGCECACTVSEGVAPPRSGTKHCQELKSLDVLEHLEFNSRYDTERAESREKYEMAIDKLPIKHLSNFADFGPTDCTGPSLHTNVVQFLIKL
jgi:hypothetical protein